MLTSISHSALLALLLAAETVFGAPHNARSEYAVKDTHHVPRKWAKVGPPPSNHRINLQIGLKQSQFLELERHLYEGILRLNSK
jgi:tripeptidyl-peptidase-1